MKKAIFIILILILSVYAFSFEKTFIGNYYTAKVNERGLISLKIKGEEFISPKGCYFMNDPKEYTGEYIPEVKDNKFITTASIGSAEYVFKDDRIEFVFKNETGSDYFISLNRFVKPINERKIEKNGICLECENELRLFAGADKMPVLDFESRWHAKAHIRETLLITSLTEDEMMNAYPDKFDMVLYSPKNCQVFQRQTKNTGKVFFGGKIKKGITGLSYKIEGNDYTGKKITPKTGFIKYNKNGEFKEYVQIPAGGWYTITVFYKNNGKFLKKILEKVGVGEVFVAAGQSNAANCAQFKSKQESGMVASTDGVNWKCGDDPQLGALGRAHEGSMYPGLGDALYSEFKVPIGFAIVSCGGTVSAEWQSWSLPAVGSVPLYSNMISRINQLGPFGFRCVIWHQGEGDVNTEEELFYNYMKSMIYRTRRDANWYIPWFTAKASYCKWKDILMTKDTVRNVHQRLWDEGISYKGPDTDTLGKEFREFNGEGVHFNLEGLKKHGKMWAECLIPYIHSNID